MINHQTLVGTVKGEIATAKAVVAKSAEEGDQR
jgi:hypothetical protein